MCSQSGDIYVHEINWSRALLEATLDGDPGDVLRGIYLVKRALRNVLNPNPHFDGADLVSVVKSAYYEAIKEMYSDISTTPQDAEIRDVLFYPRPGVADARPILFGLVAGKGVSDKSATEAVKSFYVGNTYYEYLKGCTAPVLYVGLAYDTETGTYNCEIIS